MPIAIGCRVHGRSNPLVTEIFWNSLIEKAEEGYNYLKIHQKICIVRTT